MHRPGNLSNPKIAALYRDVPAAEMQRFQDFLRQHPYQQLTHAGVTWNYLTAGSGEYTLLLLPGALGVPEVSFPLLLRFAEHFKIVAPVYAPVDTMDALVDGIAAILQHTGAADAHVLGGSYGGFVAQVFVRRCPQLTRSLVISHTQSPDPDNIASVRKSFGALTRLPLPLIRWLMNRSFSRLMPPRTDQTAFLLAISAEMIFHGLEKADWVASLRRTVDYYARRFTPADLDAWPGKILLVLSDTDRASPEAVRNTFMELYPRARMHLFHGTGHASSVLQEDEYFATVMEFLAG